MDNDTSSTAPQTATALADLLANAGRFVWFNEEQLQNHLHALLNDAGVGGIREARLSDGLSRIDLLVTGPSPELACIGVEVKIKGSLADVVRQLRRYARCPEISELILVTTRATHLNVPNLIGGKPVTVVPLLEGGL